MNPLQEKPNIEKKLGEIESLGAKFHSRESASNYILEYSCRLIEREGIRPNNHTLQLYEAMNYKVNSLETMIKGLKIKFPEKNLTIFCPLDSIETILDFESKTGKSYWVVMTSG
ncbi:MAG: hypothetical protein WCK90_01475 [archaeon]